MKRNDKGKEIETSEALPNLAFYRIRLKEHLDSKWTEWFEGLTITHEGDETLLFGPVKDQSVLHGLLNKIRDLNLTLLSVKRLRQAEKRD